MLRPAAAPGGAWGALLGVAFFATVYGVSIVDPTRIDWLLHGDPAQHYLGFAFFRNSAWQWPLGAIPDFGAPVGTSLVFTDAIPLLAIPAKLFARWLPADFQYLGAWMLLCHALHGAFAQRVLARLGVEGLARTAGVLLLLTSPALALRAYGHESLMAHWLLLAAFDAHLANRPRRMAPLLWMGALIHAYWLVLLAPFVALAWWRRDLAWAHRLGWLVAIGASMAAAGYFIARPAQLAAVGYGQYSANLLTFFDPMDWRAFLAHFGRSAEGAGEWSRLLPALGHAQADQYEGFAYLGAGVLALLAIAGVARRNEAPPAAAPTLRPLWVVAAAMFVYALSTRVTFGSRVLADPALPPALFDLLSVFRATGRFVWPLALLLPLWACARTARRLPRAASVAVLLAALALQGWDLSEKWEEFGRRFAPGGVGGVPDYSAPAWTAAASSRHLVVLPAEGLSDWIMPALFAARHRQSVNVGLLSRPDEAAAKRAEESAVADLMAGRPRAQTAYWIRDPSLVARLPRALDETTRRVALGEGAMIVPR